MTKTTTRTELERSHRITADLAALRRQKIEQDAQIASLLADHDAAVDPARVDVAPVITAMFDTITSVPPPTPARIPVAPFALRG